MQSQLVSNGFTRTCLVSIAAAIACACSGCTVVNQYRDVQDTSARVKDKEGELAQEEQKQAALQAEMKQLSADLNDRKMTGEQLDARLAALQKQNQRAASENAAQRAKQRELNAQLTQYRAELAALKQNTTMNPDEQRAKIEQLKAEIRKRLALLAQAA